MNTTPVWRIIAEREIRAQVLKKSFLITTALTVVLVVAGVVAMSVLSGRAPSYDIGVTSEQGATIAEASKAGLGEDAEIDTTTYDDEAAGEKAVEDGEVDVLLVESGDGWEVVGDEEVPVSLSAALASAVRATAITTNAAEQDVDLEALNEGTQLEERLLTGDAEDRDALNGFGFGMGILYYAMALVFGIQIAQSVVQERESRVVEILAAAVPTRALLWGKVAANTLLAVGQATLVVVAALISMQVTGMTDLLGGVGPALGWYLAYFLIGFIALTALWSAAGTLAGRTADVNSTTLPMQVVLFGGYFLGAFVSGRTQEIASLVPVISPMIMPYRIALGEAPLWQILLGLALNVVAAYLLIRLGSRIYDRHLLQTGRKVGFMEALRG